MTAALEQRRSKQSCPHRNADREHAVEEGIVEGEVVQQPLQALPFEVDARRIGRKQLALAQQVHAGDQRADRHIRRQLDRRAEQAAADEDDAVLLRIDPAP